MAYANQEDVEKILPEDEEVPEGAVERLETVLEEATDLVVGYLEREYTGDDDDNDEVPDDVPGAVRRVTARVALRAFVDEPANPGAESEVNLMGPFSHTINWMKDAQSRSLYLTDGEKLRLDKYVAGYTGGVTHMPMAGACGTDWYIPGFRYG